jgi:hypothetical protein
MSGNVAFAGSLWRLSCESLPGGARLRGMQGEFWAKGRPEGGLDGEQAGAQPLASCALSRRYGIRDEGVPAARVLLRGAERWSSTSWASESEEGFFGTTMAQVAKACPFCRSSVKGWPG